ncbi:MAG: hypothetical protein COC22_05800 [Flavobacteriaceae bacterium]|nr:MAG: hypothetical protein COC22_05800 [Flavobacteriaceae bacterium]
MITKNYNSIFSYLLALTIGLFIVSCGQEDYTGTSTFVPTAPTLSVTTSVSSASLTEDNSVYTFTATLSEPQLVDVKLFVSQVGGDATLGDDYTIDGSLTISAGSTSATGKIKILSDNLVEDTETVSIQIGDNLTSNAALTPATMDFTILNYTEGDLVIDMSWAMGSKTTDNSGSVIDPTVFADLRLLLTDAPNNTAILDAADGSSFETYVLSGTVPDGEYYLIADFYAVDETINRDLNLNLTFNQAGVINGDSYSFPAALNSTNSCSSVYYVMAKVVKSGDNYTVTSVAEKSPVTAAPFIGTATAVVDEWADYAAGDQTDLLAVQGDPFSFVIDTPDFMGWIANNDTTAMVVTIEPATGNVTIQAYDYTIDAGTGEAILGAVSYLDYGQPGGGGFESGTGFVNACNGEINLSVTYGLAAWGDYPANALVLQSDNF